MTAANAHDPIQQRDAAKLHVSIHIFGEHIRVI